jgi:hypothetical protein
MGFFDRFRRGWSLERVERPWPSRPSIYGFLRDHADPKSATLPDEKEEVGSNRLRFAPGATDGIFGHHVEPGDDALRVKEIVYALENVCADPNRLAELYDTERPVLGVVDALSVEIRKSKRLPPDRLHAIARMLATEGADREPVKLGMALLGLFEGVDDRDVLMTLGSHDELTLFAVVALVNQSDDAELALFELAKKVEGWGRIHAVEQLAEAKRPEVRAWLLREGFRNSVMDEYLAYTCAVAGELHVALEKKPDAALMLGAADLLAALATEGGPAQGLSAWSDAPIAIERWLGHIEKLDLPTLTTLDALSDPEELPEALRARIAKLASSDEAAALVTSGLASKDQGTFTRANAAALRRGIDTFDAHEERLATGDAPPGSMFHLMHQATPKTIDRALAVASTQIDLAKIATGASDSLGFGAAFAPHRDLDFVLQELERFPGKGEEFVRAALKSPVVRNRNMALRAIAAWKRERWSPHLAAAVRDALAVEPEEEVKATFERVVAGRPYDPESN